MTIKMIFPLTPSTFSTSSYSPSNISIIYAKKVLNGNQHKIIWMQAKKLPCNSMSPISWESLYSSTQLLLNLWKNINLKHSISEINRPFPTAKNIEGSISLQNYTKKEHQVKEEEETDMEMVVSKKLMKITKHRNVRWWLQKFKKLLVKNQKILTMQKT